MIGAYVRFCGCSRGAFDEGGGKAEVAAESCFPDSHFSVVGLVVFAGEMEEAVEEEDFYFVGEGVAVRGCLAGGGVERDGEVTCVFFGELVRRREAEDVGGFIFAAKGFIELAEGGVGGEKNVYLTSETYGETGAIEEARQAGDGKVSVC